MELQDIPSRRYMLRSNQSPPSDENGQCHSIQTGNGVSNVGITCICCGRVAPRDWSTGRGHAVDLFRMLVPGRNTLIIVLHNPHSIG